MLRLLRHRGNRKCYLDHAARIVRSKGEGLAAVCQAALEPVLWEREIFRVNETYSNDLVFKRFLGLDPGTSLRAIIEHGCVLTEVLVENHLALPAASRNIVMSRVRADFLASRGISATPVGPYLHYAQSFFDEDELTRMKAELGKTLLFFPSHSTLDVSVKESFGDLNGMVAALKEAHGFDSVLVCGYFMDIDNGLFRIMERKDGYHFVTCGHRLGPFFLNLLKSFLLLADVVASNSVGTQTGYALFLDKPFWVVGDKAILSYYQGESDKVQEELAISYSPLVGCRECSLPELENMFRNESYRVEEGTRNLVAKLWGFDDILSRKELHAALM